ncbi:MAG: tryptophan synthase subunit alpha [Candidatus Omnitrophota bacterium]
MADGPIIQRATSAAIEKGANINNFLVELAKLQECLTIPAVVMSYYNPIFRFGMQDFFKKAKHAGASGLIMVDLPLEEAKDYIEKARGLELDTIFFVTPVTSAGRIKKIVKYSRGFIYYISVTGITGPKELDYSSLASQVRNIKRVTDLPICVGFGIHSREQVIRISEFSDGVIVGSEIVKFIEKHHGDKGFLSKLEKHIRVLTGKN